MFTFKQNSNVEAIGVGEKKSNVIRNKIELWWKNIYARIILKIFLETKICFKITSVDTKELFLIYLLSTKFSLVWHKATKIEHFASNTLHLLFQLRNELVNHCSLCIYYALVLHKAKVMGTQWGSNTLHQFYETIVLIFELR